MRVKDMEVKEDYHKCNRRGLLYVTDREKEVRAMRFLIFNARIFLA